MKTCKSLLLFFVASHAILFCNSQAPFTETIVRNFGEHTAQALPEKLFVHTDKNFYLTGEILWLKLYAMDGLLHRPLDLSKLAYVELINEAGNPVLQAKIGMKDASGNGSLYLPATLNSGVYTLRAYTNWMKNFGADYFFVKTITLVNGKKTFLEEKRPVKPRFDIQFFPEGGNLVNGIGSRIGFRIVNEYGKGISCKGLVVDDLSDTLTSFEPPHFGIGSFRLVPKTGRKYNAIINIPGVGQLVKELPAAFDNGYTLQLDSPVNGKLAINISAAFKTGGESGKVYLFAHTRGLVKSSTEINITNGHAQLLVDMNLLGDGISHFTLFNADRQPVCERLVFKYPTRNLQVKMNARKEYGIRQKIDIDFSTMGFDNRSLNADLSVAVYRIDSLQSPDGMNISSYVWLSSDLPGRIESPEYYFTSRDSGISIAMDNLMLTHGWRRFSWSDITADTKPSFRFMPEYNGHLIQGKITHMGNQAPGVSVPAFLAVPGRRTQFHESSGDSSGKVNFEMKNFYGQEVIVQTNGQKDSLYRVTLTDPFFDQYPVNPPGRFSLSQDAKNTLLERHIGVQAQNIYAGKKLALFDNSAIDSAVFYVKPDVAYLLDNYTRFTTMEEILREYVPLVFVKKREGHYHFSVFESISRSLFTLDPLALLDGTPVFDTDKFMKYDPLKIWKLEVVARKYYYGDLAYDGILNFITYRGDLPDFELNPNATVIDYEGVQMQREFFSPVYETTAQVAGRLPDFRNLLFWSPDVQKNANGKISFYTSDLPGKYTVMLQGISADGQAGSGTLMFEVKEALSPLSAK
ncbi:MAG: hypothetical protein ABI687_04890 [Flavitalea sp.]